MWLVMRVVCSTRVAFDGTRSQLGQAGVPNLALARPDPRRCMGQGGDCFVHLVDFCAICMIDSCIRNMFRGVGFAGRAITDCRAV